jgi:purine-cytosine permease-like protein
MMIKNKLIDQLDAIDEFEREPIPNGKLKNLKSFIGMYAGEHTAGTEFVIGPLFVAHGASAGAIVAGLFFGNLLAVLSWGLLTAPIATRKRLTLYFQLEKICGKHLVKMYNVINGMMFCFLAGSMIAVSATAVGIPFNIAMPTLNDWLPTSIGWIIVVLLVGLVITLVAIMGYEQVSRFANLAAPWMIIVFIAAAFAVMPDLGIHSFGNLWEIANTRIWTGIPLEGQSKFTFWHIMFFAWFANMAMHIGMADLSIFRYAKKWSYGFSSATGMYVGHYIAWMASGILYAYFLSKYGSGGEFAPGKIAYEAAGLAGAICVVIAGWTTANPTIYRAGLAFQSINPKWKRWKVTLITGLFTSIAAFFPALVMKLLDFVAIYGFVLMPMGAVIFIDFYIIRKIGLHDDYAEKTNINFNWAAGLAWFVTLISGLALNVFLEVEVFFLGLPGWFIASAIFILMSYILQKRNLKTVTS